MSDSSISTYKNIIAKFNQQDSFQSLAKSFKKNSVNQLEQRYQRSKF